MLRRRAQACQFLVFRNRVALADEQVRDFGAFLVNANHGLAAWYGISGHMDQVGETGIE